MTTLSTNQLAPLLDRLFAEAEEASAETEAAVADLSDEEQARRRQGLLCARARPAASTHRARWGGSLAIGRCPAHGTHE